MAKKSSTTTATAAPSVTTVKVQAAADTNTIDINLADQVSVQDNADNDVSSTTQDSAKKDDSSFSSSSSETKSDIPAFDTEGTVSYLLKKACGVRYDLDKMVADCNGDSTELRRAYNKVSWHLGRIRSCEDADHTMHTGRYTADGKEESELLKNIKTLFSQK